MVCVIFKFYDLICFFFSFPVSCLPPRPQSRAYRAVSGAVFRK